MKKIEKTKKSCDTCAWNAGVCTEMEFGVNVNELKEKYPNGCECWRVGIIAYHEYLDQFEDKIEYREFKKKKAKGKKNGGTA